MLHVVILLLVSSCVALCSNSHQAFYLINAAKSWEEAQSYCRENYNDLATIGSHDDMRRLVSATEASGMTGESWIGLRKTGASSWLWSVGYGLTEYTNWAGSLDSTHHCGGMGDDGKWRSALCETTLPFVCQQDEGSNEMHVVLQEKSWRKAQEYCRVNYTDLAAVRSLTENKALQILINENPGLSLVWIGLFRDEWKWSDQSDSSFRYWDSSQPNNDGSCVLYRPTDKTWYDRGCSDSFSFCCYKEIEKRKKKIVRLEITSNSVLDISDSAVSKAILKQIQQKLEGFKLQWRVQPDGKIFHEKEKEKFTKAC